MGTVTSAAEHENVNQLAESDKKVDIVNTKDIETMTDSVNIQDIVEVPSSTTSSTDIQSNDEKTDVVTISTSNTFSDEHVKKLLKVMHVYSRYTNLTHRQLPPTLVYFAQVCKLLSNYLL